MHVEDEGDEDISLAQTADSERVSRLLSKPGAP